MKECTLIDSRQTGRCYSRNILYVTLLFLWLTVDCFAAPSIPPPPDGLTLGPDEQAMLESLVDEAIAQEEILRSRRHEANKRFSGSIPKDEHPHEEYGPPPPDYKTKSFSLWSFKKAVLSALFQSLKAITGGVIALSGQLVRAKGHLVAAKGHLLETKGGAISELGNLIAAKAIMTPMHSSSYDHSSTGSGTGSTGYSYTPPSSHGGHYPPSAPPTSYGPPGHNSHHSSHSSPPSHPPSPSYGPPGHGSHSYEYNGPPPSNYLPSTASFNSAPESWLMAANNFAEPPLIHQDIHHTYDNYNFQKGHHPIQKKEVPKGLQAGLILLKPVKEEDLVNSGSFNQAKIFSTNPTLIEIQESKVPAKKSS